MNQDAVGGLSLAGVAGGRCPSSISIFIAADALYGAKFAVRYFEVVGGRGELDAVAHGKAAQLLAEDRDALLPARIIGALRTVQQLDCEPVAWSVDALYLRVSVALSKR